MPFFPQEKENLIYNLQNLLSNTINDIHIDFSIDSRYSFNKITQQIELSSSISDTKNYVKYCGGSDGYDNWILTPTGNLACRFNTPTAIGVDNIGQLLIGYYTKYNSTDFFGVNLIFDTEINIKILNKNRGKL